MGLPARNRISLPQHYAFLILILIIYFIFAALIGSTKYPSDDEAWFASSAINLLEKGHMGISVKEVAGTQWTRMDQHTYWQPPLHFLAQAGWYSIFDFSLFSMRFMSAFWGIVTLLSVFSIVNTLTGNRAAALLAMGLTAVDFLFINAASDGRMDMMTTSLAYAGFAGYLSLREKNLSMAMLTGHALIVASGLTHAHGIVAFAGIITLNLFFDWKRIKLKHVLFAFIPYVVGAVGWGLYIMQDPQAFIDQFLGHVSRKTGASPSILDSFWMEISRRYLYAYGFTGNGSAIGKLKLFILISYLVGVIGSFFLLRRSKQREPQALVILLVLYFLIMSILLAEKSYLYLIHILPLYTSLLAIWISLCWVKSRVPKYVIVLFIIILCAMHIGINVRFIHKDTYHNIYLPVASELSELDDGSVTIMGTAELAFHIGFNPNFIDDPALGYYSGRSPDIIVMTPWYYRWFKRFERLRPELYEYVTQLLENDFEKVYEHTLFEIHQKKQ